MGPISRPTRGHRGRNGFPPGIPPMFDRRTRHHGTKNTSHQKLFAECQREHGRPLKELAGRRKLLGAKMNTAAPLPCQTSGPRSLRYCLQFLAFVTALNLACPTSWAEPAEPPAWKRELDAVRLAEATAALLATSKPADATERDRRLEELYRQLVAQYPDQPTVRKAAGDHFWRSGDAATAVAEWQAAQALDPSDAETASALGSARLRDGQTREAREQFQRAVDARPGNARYHFDLANVLFLFRHDLAGSPPLPDEPTVLREALAQFRRASELAPEDGGIARAYAETFYGVPQPDWAEALAAWKHVLTLTADAPDFANGHLARVSLRLGLPEQAETYLDLIHDPAFASVVDTLRRQAEALKRQAATRSPAP